MELMERLHLAILLFSVPSLEEYTIFPGELSEER